jgi:hypothetical protein
MQWTHLLPQMPRLVYQALTDRTHEDRMYAELHALRVETQRCNRLLLFGVVGIVAVAAIALWIFFGLKLPGRG